MPAFQKDTKEPVMRAQAVLPCCCLHTRPTFCLFLIFDMHGGRHSCIAPTQDLCSICPLLPCCREKHSLRPFCFMRGPYTVARAADPAPAHPADQPPAAQLTPNPAAVQLAAHPAAAQLTPKPAAAQLAAHPAAVRLAPHPAAAEPTRDAPRPAAPGPWPRGARQRHPVRPAAAHDFQTLDLHAPYKCLGSSDASPCTSGFWFGIAHMLAIMACLSFQPPYLLFQSLFCALQLESSPALEPRACHTC